MENQRSGVKKKTNPSSEARKEQAAAYETLRKEVEELRKEADNNQEMQRQARAFEQPKKRISPYQEELPYSAQLDSLLETLKMLNPRDLNAIGQCTSAITFFENLQLKTIAEIRKDDHTKPDSFSDTQSILHTSSVRKKEKEALEIIKPTLVS